ncbi:MAG: hypothetical protein U1F43_15580 [Myxococcota bacterium]
MEAIVGLVSLTAGALLGGVVKVVFDRYTAFTESKGVATALRAEIDGLLRLMETRGYGPRIAQIIADASRPDHVVTADDILSVRTTQDYFVVFRSVMSKVGLLDDLGARVIYFYSLARAIVEDVGELREYRQAILDKRLAPTPAEVVRWHTEMGQLLARTLEDGARLIPDLEAFTHRRFLGVFK